MKKIIQIENLSKSFYKNGIQSIVFSNINLNIYEGDFIYIHGDNGYGKTTLLRLLLNIYLPDSGKIKYFHNLVPQKLGYLSQNNKSFFLNLSLYENLKYYMAVNGLFEFDSIDYWLSCFDLEKKKKLNMISLSDGELKKASIIKVFLKDPSIYFFDELSNSLSQNTLKKVYSIIKDQKLRKNKTIVWISHVENEIEFAEERHVFIENNKLTENKL